MGTSSSHGDGLPQVYCGGHVKVPVRVKLKNDMTFHEWRPSSIELMQVGSQKRH